MIMSLSRFADYLLTLLIKNNSTSPSRSRNLLNLAEHSNIELMPNWVEHAAIRLELDGYIEIIEEIGNAGPSQNYIAFITEKGIQHEATTRENDQEFSGLNSFEFMEEQDGIHRYVLGELLAEQHTQKNDGWLSAQDISNNDPDGYGAQDYQNILDRYLGYGITRKNKDEGLPLYTLTPQGVYFTLSHSPGIFDLEQWPNAKDLTKDIIDALDEIWGWYNSIHDADINVNVENQPVPASDRVVSLNHNSQEFLEAEQALENVINAIEKSNEQGPEEKQPVLMPLQNGKEYIKNNKILVGAASGMLLTPLYNVYSSYAEEGLRRLVEIAIQAVKTLLGI